MGAKKKPQEQVSLGDLGVEAGQAGEQGSATTVLALSEPPARGESRRVEGRRRRRRRVSRRSSYTTPKDAAHLGPSTLVFLEHHGDQLEKGPPRRADEGGDARRRRRRRARRIGCPRARIRGGQVRRRQGLRLGRRRRRGAAPAAARRRARRSHRAARLRHRPLRGLRARRGRRRRPGSAPRRRPELGPDDIAQQDGELVGMRPALEDTVYADVGWTSTPRLGLFRSGSFDPASGGRRGRGRGVHPELRDFSTAATMVEQPHEESCGPALEEADVIVAGGRGLGGPENFTLVRGAGEGARRRGRRDPRGRRRRLVPVRAPDRPDRQDRLAEALRRRRHLRRDPAQGRHAGLERHRRDQQGRERADLRLLRPRRRRRPARDRPEAHRAVAAGAPVARPPTRRPRPRDSRASRSADAPTRSSPGRPTGRRAHRRRDPHRRRRPRRPRLRDPARAAARRAPRSRATGSATCRSRCSRRASSPGRTCSPGPCQPPRDPQPLRRAASPIEEMPT